MERLCGEDTVYFLVRGGRERVSLGTVEVGARLYSAFHENGLALTWVVRAGEPYYLKTFHILS